MLDCQRTVSLLSDYLDAEEGVQWRRNVEEHLGGARGCNVVFDSTRLRLLLTGNGKTFVIPPKALARCVSALSTRLPLKLPGDCIR